MEGNSIDTELQKENQIESLELKSSVESLFRRLEQIEDRLPGIDSLLLINMNSSIEC
jgi:hypothetical protein